MELKDKAKNWHSNNQPLPAAQPKNKESGRKKFF
jgi:hypothetical protein